MKQNINTPVRNALNYIDKQPCVIAIRKSKIPRSIKNEMEKFIKRNILPDCKRVSPNCVKAHLIKISKRLKFSKNKTNSLKKLFKSRIGYKGYYLDDGKLKKI